MRAGIFVGVDKTGNLQKLNDAAAGAKLMHDWAVTQGMVSPSQAKLITDAGGTKVTPDNIYDAIKEIIDGPGADQLILYFAGHGVNINRNEHWLLTDAPLKTSAAVNVSGSVELARYCGIGHVVVISDACRVAPEGIQAQNVLGVDVFPNEATGERSKPVDQFFACLLGRTAAEIRDPALAAGSFRALYTQVLLEALNGKQPEVLVPSDTAGDPASYVKPVKLEAYLEREVPLRVRAMNLQNRVNQNPDAILIAHEKWISRIEPPLGPTVERRPPSGPQAPSPPSPAGPRAPAPPFPSAPGDPAGRPRGNLRTATAKLVRTALQGPDELAEEISRVAATDFPGAQTLTGTVKRVAPPFGPDHFETECGIKVRGAQIRGYAMKEERARLLSPEALRINLNQGAMSVLLRFEGNVGTVIPAVAGFVAAVTIQDGELVDVAYEPSTNSWRWTEFKNKADEVRALRAVAASASQHGRFRLDQEGSFNIARKMQYAKGIDPTLAIYAAYAYHDLQATDRIREMSRYQRDDLGVTFFDLALLSRELAERDFRRSDGKIVPFVPLFSQGWPLLAANRVRLHPSLDGVERTMRESVWSLFDGRGIDMLYAALMSKEVR